MKLTQLFLAIGAPTLALAIACGDEAPAPAAAGAVPAAKPKAAASAAAAAPVSADGGTVVPAAPFQYAYNPLGKRDPFRSPQDEPRGPTDTSTALCNEPLCQWDLDQLSLRAVVSGDANPLAMAEDPNGLGHMIRRSTKMGKQGGKVTQILHNCIVVTEFWTGPDGKVNPNPVKVCIKEEAMGAPLLDLMDPQKRY